MRLSKILFCGFVLGIAFLNFYCNSNKSTAPVKLTNYASLLDTTKYVGKETCRSCHTDIYDSYMHTGMGSSFDVASTKKTSAKFEHALVLDKEGNFFYQPYFENDSLRILEFRLDGKDTIYKRKETINFIVGSGQHTNSHITNSNGYLTQVPATFYTQKGIWDLPPGFEDGNNSRFNRIIGLECMSCHNAYPDFVLGSENKYNTVQRGIDCERCHGPGSVHVQQKMLGMLVDTAKEIDYTIVNPSKLPIDKQFDVCQRCHIQGNAVLNDGKSFFDFKPGMHLSEVMNVFMPVYKGRDNEHIMASHAERLKMSKCYTVTMDDVEKNKSSTDLKPYKNALTCITCHNPHVSVKQTGNSHFNKSCNNCHTTQKDNLCTQKESVLKANNFNCIKCHMNFSSTIDIPHVKVHDHYIRKPIDENKIAGIKKLVTISAINNPNPTSKSIGDAYIAYVEKFGFDYTLLDSALKYLPQTNEGELNKNFKSLIQLYFLRKDYAAVIGIAEQIKNIEDVLNTKSYSNTDAWACYRIAEAYEKMGNMIKAIIFYRKATMLAPFQLDFLNKYATALSITGNNKDAKLVYERIISENPKNHTALCNLGFLYLSVEHNSTKAMELYNKALALNPDYEQALLNKAGLLLYLNNTSEAKKLLMQILKINKENKQAMEILKRLS
ncbi:MAG TPA: tetratricopeptide repeat protein [Bacteroidia bacterium]|nr:tetratricopeptide repeat protein [Bacteroidia bacterium]